MPSPKIECPGCGGPMSAVSKRCRKCSQPYERTPEIRQQMSNTAKGKPKPWLRGRKRPEHSKKMREWWTQERREARRQAMLQWNPLARYHGLSAKGAARLRRAAGQCEECGHDGSESRLDVHHRNGDKHDQCLRNLVVLCHRCHMRIHSERGEIGWKAYHAKRKMNPD